MGLRGRSDDRSGRTGLDKERMIMKDQEKECERRRNGRDRIVTRGNGLWGAEERPG